MGIPRIMVVEDEIIIAMDIKSQVERLGYQVPVVARSGEEAISEAKENDLDLVLMDIGLSGQMNGIEAGHKISSEFDIPIVYVTASTDEHTLNQIRTSGPSGLLIKPYKEDELRAVIEKAVTWS